MIKRITLIVIAILSIMFVVEQQDTYKPNYTKLSSDKLMFDDDMEIKATDGSNFSNDSLKNKYTYVFFGYTNCPDFCPDTLIKLKRLSNLVKNQNPDQIIQGVFALKHLVLFGKCTNLCNSIQMYLKNDYPLIIKYTVASLGEIKLCLAPKCSNE